MELSQLTTEHLKRLSSLLKEKESLEAKLSKLNDQINGFGGGKSSNGTKRGRPPGSTAKGGKRAGRGQVGPKILKALAQAGSEGLSTTEVVKKAKISTPGFYNWMNRDGKKTAGFKQVGRGKFVYLPTS